MEPLCVYENRKCVNYGFEDWPIIEVSRISSKFEKDVTHLMVLYALDGCVKLSYGLHDAYPLSTGDIMLFPPGIRLSVMPVEATASVLILKIKTHIVLCDKYPLGNIYGDHDLSALHHSHIEAVPPLKNFMETLAGSVTGRMTCYKFMELKIIEFFHYLRSYYNHAQLAGFALPLVSPNSQFMYFVWNNYRKVHNVLQFARMANCSLSAFKVKFKNVTGMPPSQWLNEQKARNVFHEISIGEKSLKEISEKYHFSSVSHLGTFCRKNFGMSPGNLKPGKKKREYSRMG